MEARTEWTDERLDDLAEAMKPLPREVAAVPEAVDHLTDEMKGLRTDFSAMQRQLTQIGWALVGTLAAAMVALIVALVAS
jgi:hypothetical protein